MTKPKTHPFFETFAERPVIMPVIHFGTPHQAAESSLIASSEGVDGIWLIDHHGRPVRELLNCYANIQDLHPKLWIGLNFLNLDPENAFRQLPIKVSGYWCDSLGLNTARPEDREQATRITEALALSEWGGLFFGGVAFKYQRAVTLEDLPDVTLAARDILDDRGVVTTSGPLTGSPPELIRVRIMRDALDSCTESRRQRDREEARFPLAIASGIGPDNIGPYLGLVDCFMVASSITDSNSELLIPKAVRALMRAAGR